MKRFIFLFLSAALLSCGSQNNELDQTDWILGKWIRVNDNNDFKTYEFWERSSASSFKGIGFSLRGSDTTFVERLSLELQDGELFYIADTRENDDAVAFQITSLTETGFISENPEHDFPKMITYEYENDRMVATISDGNGPKVDFVFIRMR